MMQELALNSFDKAEVKKLKDWQCLNWVPTLSDSGSLSTISLMPTSGVVYGDPVEYWNDNWDTGEITGQIGGYDGFNSVTQFVVGGRLVAFDGDDYGAYALPDSPVGGGGTVGRKCELSRFATDGNNLVFVGPYYANTGFDRGYYANTTLTVTAIDLNAGLGNNKAGAVDVAYLGGRFLYLASNSVLGYNRVHYSAIGSIDPDPLDFFAPQGNSEQLHGVETLNDRLYLFGETNTYMYQVSQSVDVPFQLVGTVNYGLAGRDGIKQFAKCKYMGNIAFYGKQKNSAGSIYMFSGASVQKISNKNIDRVISKNSESLRLFSFTEKGRNFLAVRSATICLVYEADSGMWHERSTYGRESWAFIGSSELANGQGSVFIGDAFLRIDNGPFQDLAFLQSGYTDIQLGTELASEKNESNTLGLVDRRVVSSPFNSKNDRIILSELQPQCDVDFSNINELWPKPQINISVSYDFGNTFEKERSLTVGSIGNYKSTTRFFNFGYVDQSFTVRLRAMNPYPMSIIRLLARTEKGYS